jgi:hypothetical protein
MKSLASFLLFNGAWFLVVAAAARGDVWLGVWLYAAVIAVHLALLVPRGERSRELVYVLAVGAVGLVLDTGLHAVGATNYPASSAAWPYLVVPPWIVSLWAGFATIVRHSLAWLRGRHVLAALLGAVGGPLSYFGGSRLGAVAHADSELFTYGLLALEYAVVTPLLVAFAPQPGRARVTRTVSDT